MSSTLATDLLDVAGGNHSGFRPVHAKGVIYCGTDHEKDHGRKRGRSSNGT
jgi:hypothetical protein